MTARHCIAALCHPRSQWPTRVARWATSGAAPVTLLTCMSVDELTSLLASGRNVSAVLLDGAITRLDRDLVAAPTAVGAVPVGVQCAERAVDWEAIGVTRVLATTFDRDDLVAMLAGMPIGQAPPGVAQPGGAVFGSVGSTPRRADLVAVCGSPGTGASVTAAALAAGLAGAGAGNTMLVDGARRGHQGLYHDTADVIPSLIDLVAKVIANDVAPEDLETVTFSTRDYRVLLGAPTPREADQIAHDTARRVIDTICGHTDVVVVDHDGDAATAALPGALAAAADTWVVVTSATMKGLHDAAALILEASEVGVPAERQLVVLNGVGRGSPARTVFDADLARLIAPVLGRSVASLALPRVHMERRLRDAAALPRQFVVPLVARVREALQERTSSGNPRRTTTASHDGPAMTEVAS